MQEIDGSKLAVVDRIPSKGYAAFKVVEQLDEDEEILLVDQSHAETPFFHVEWNDKGQFISIYDKKADRELLPAGEKTVRTTMMRGISTITILRKRGKWMT